MTLLLQEEVVMVLENKKPELDDSGFSCSAMNGTLLPPIIAEPIIIDKAKAMADQDKKTIPHFRIPRSIFHNPFWKSLTPIQVSVFFGILNLAAFRPQKFNDYGKIIDILPGQVCISATELSKALSGNISKKQIQRAIARLEVVQILSLSLSRKRMIITIKDKDTYDLILEKDVPTNVPILSRSCPDLVPTKKDNVDNVDKEDSSFSKGPDGPQKKRPVRKAPKVFEADVVILSEKLIDLLKSENLDYRPSSNLEPFKTSVQSLLNQKHSPSRILEVLSWALKDNISRGEFPGWCSIMYSKNPAESLKKHFSKIARQMESKAAKKFYPCSDNQKITETMTKTNEVVL